ncbi:hypothetical protein ABZX72_34315 [Streptomyces cyaneofuscatus]|uniref:hypothetical protein n=1 Tax=Streptomyces cyaneofuscatus TaxID=66883 RepID=UPI0033B00B6D
MLSDRITITPDEMKEIADRLTPHLPPNLTRAKAHPSGFGMEYTFAPFTGREPEPAKPPTHKDERLKYVPEDQDEREHHLRHKAGTLLSDMYDRARVLWQEAAYVADLKDAVQDAPARWTAYMKERVTLEAAAAYLRTPQASTEWPSAVARLVDAQRAAAAAAAAFDERGQVIAQVHRTYLYADLGQHAALTAAGYPEATAWHIADIDGYDGWGLDRTLAQHVDRLIKEQDDHLAKVHRLTGTDN